MMFDSLFRWIHIHMFLGDFKEFIHLLLRWVHVFTGILWVGTTYYFTWLDGRFSELEAVAKESGGALGPTRPTPGRGGALRPTRPTPEGGGGLGTTRPTPEKQIWMVHS